jgi:hypothetical protein
MPRRSDCLAVLRFRDSNAVVPCRPCALYIVDGCRCVLYTEISTGMNTGHSPSVVKMCSAATRTRRNNFRNVVKYMSVV